MNPQFIRIEAGTYTLGVPVSPGTIQHKWKGPVNIAIDSFLLAECSVTSGEFIAFLKETKGTIIEPFAHLSKQAADCPAGGISWYDACEFIEWMRRKTGRPYRLPNCNEWEVAARGGLVGSSYPWGDGEPHGRCNFAETSGQVPIPVRSFAPNGYGLYDMAGSIWNWCSDLWRVRVADDPPVNSPTGLDPRDNRVLRGGSYMTSIPGYLMCAYIHEDPPDLRHPSIGLRLACDIENKVT